MGLLDWFRKKQVVNQLVNYEVLLSDAKRKFLDQRKKQILSACLEICYVLKQAEDKELIILDKNKRDLLIKQAQYAQKINLDNFNDEQVSAMSYVLVNVLSKNRPLKVVVEEAVEFFNCVLAVVKKVNKKAA
ncbi:hypothetical protein HYV79_01205 [Candidatus Woesearchaeota archaeon]|nr:hypothetical protein [Candidatus Woesearchaeota archaeon]